MIDKRAFTETSENDFYQIFPVPAIFFNFGLNYNR